MSAAKTKVWVTVKCIMTLISWVAILIATEYIYTTTPWMKAVFGPNPEIPEVAIAIIFLLGLLFFVKGLAGTDTIEDNLLFDADILIAVCVILLVCQFVICLRVAAIWFPLNQVMAWIVTFAAMFVWNVIYWSIDREFDILPRNNCWVASDDD